MPFGQPMNARSRVRRERLDANGLPSILSLLRPQTARIGDTTHAVADIIEGVRARGDEALVDEARRFGAPMFSKADLRVDPTSLREALGTIAPELRRALEIAAEQVREVSEAVRPGDQTVTLQHGQRVTIRSIPVDSAGCYVPGGRATYPSSLVMACVPAQVAGVGRIAIASPPGADNRVSEVVRATAAILGVDEVYAVGGAAAVGALAYGTSTIAPVAVISGPGNAWVREAKRQVQGEVGIDSLAGPSEVLILADSTADAELLAADLVAQAEHGADSISVLACTDPGLTDRVAELLGTHLAPGGITLIDVNQTRDMVALAEAFAPEHLQIALGADDVDRVASQITRSGCVFVGRNGGTAFGDYIAGSNHILPTGGSARFSSAVGPATYMRRMSLVDLPQRAVDALAPHLDVIARAEGFPEHARSATIRMSQESRS